MKLSSAKILAGVAGLATVLSLALPVSAMTVAEIQAQIAALQSQLGAIGGSLEQDL